ncbi:MAG: hypothetical protein A2X45_20780 [Lentisphaerae bacterium GWF2_50_93]|nr:MAG: hypothetical protein A2X45_20780 [Lentisphaerae bacterium GWF2_50_93]
MKGLRTISMDTGTSTRQLGIYLKVFFLNPIEIISPGQHSRIRKIFIARMRQAHRMSKFENSSTRRHPCKIK